MTSKQMMTYWGVEVKSGKPLNVELPRDKVVHISQACLGESKKEKANENVRLYLNFRNRKRKFTNFVLGNLSTEKVPQLSMDILFERSFELSHNWKHGSVYFTGYQVTNHANDGIFTSDDEPYYSPSEMEMKMKMHWEGDELYSPEELEMRRREEDKAKAKQSKPGTSASTEAKSAPGKSGSKEKSKPGKSGTTEGKQKAKLVESKPNEEDSSSEEESDSTSDDSSTKGKQKAKIESKTNEEDDSTSDDDSTESEETNGEDEDDEESSDDSKEETPEKPERSKKRSVDSGKKTPASKKAKLVTPQKTEGKTETVHVSTPHPVKQTSKPFTCKTCSRSFASDMALQAHTNAKHRASN